MLLDKTEDSERIKNLSTARTFKTEAKGKDRIETEFFGKFILCSNNEDSFIKIEPGETRYWVRRVNQLQHIKVNLLEELQEEIPAFLHFINTRPLTSKNQSRMWFTHQQIRTEALQKVIRRSRNWLELEMSEILLGLMDDFELDQICVCVNDIIPFLTRSGYRATRSQIIKTLKDQWKLSPIDHVSTYKRIAYLPDGSTHQVSSKGRYYIINRGKLMDFC